MVFVPFPLASSFLQINMRATQPAHMGVVTSNQMRYTSHVPCTCKTTQTQQAGNLGYHWYHWIIHIIHIGCSMDNSMNYHGHPYNTIYGYLVITCNRWISISILSVSTFQWPPQDVISCSAAISSKQSGSWGFALDMCRSMRSVAGRSRGGDVVLLGESRRHAYYVPIADKSCISWAVLISQIFFGCFEAASDLHAVSK
jgi:hypothetical protein